MLGSPVRSPLIRNIKHGFFWFFLFLFFFYALFLDTFLSFLYLSMKFFFFFLKTVGAWNSNLEGQNGKKTQNYARVNINRLGLMKTLGHLQSFFAMNDIG